MRKAFEKGTYVPGAYVIVDKLGQPVIAEEAEQLNAAGKPASGHNGVLTVQRKGETLWQRARTSSHVIHFASAAGKLRALANMTAQGKTLAGIKKAGLPLAAFAEPKDLKMVPVYRGLECRLANRLRAAMRRQEARRAA
jgi:hypothetical protein